MPESLIAADLLEGAALTGSGTTIGAGIEAAGGAAAASAATGAAISGSEVLSGLKSAATILSPIASLASTAAGISGAKKSALGGAPAVAPPITMPILGDQANMASLVGNLQAQAVRRGRAATILTSPDSGQKLGS